MTDSSASSRNEVPVFFQRSDAELFGIITRPSAPSNGTGVLLSWGSGPYASCGRNQIRMRLARQVAARGYHALRYDYEGVGESTGIRQLVRFDTPWVADVSAAHERLQAEDIHQTVLVGYCFGGRNTLASLGSFRDPVAVVLIAVPVVDMDHAEMFAKHQSIAWNAKQALRNFTRPNKRRRHARIIRSRVGSVFRRATGALGGNGAAGGEAAKGIVAAVRHLVDNKVPTLFVYSTADPAWLDFCAAREGALSSLLARGGDLFTVRPIEASVRELQSQVALQDQVIKVVTDWLEGIPSAVPAERTRSVTAPNDRR
jgi:pimeloyl-ACP methyl ester carboxylesterase